MPRSTFLALASLAILGSSAACNDPTRANATEEVRTDSLELFAFNGSSPRAPSAIAIFDRSARTLSAAGNTASTVNFDVAFDIDAQGRAILYPARLVLGSFVGTQRVGIQTVGGSFESVTRAPTSGYRYDSATVAPVGSTVVVEVTDPICGFSYLGTTIFGKIAVDSVLPEQRRLRVRLASDPNCGFRSLAPGLPKE
jgi:hypothetical protein